MSTDKILNKKKKRSSDQNNLKKSDAPPKKFRIRGKLIALTYPRCNVPMDIMMDRMLKFPRVKIVIIGKELHSKDDKETDECHSLPPEFLVHPDIDEHYHIFLELESPLDTSKCTYFDIDFEGDIFHPNVQTVKQKINWIKYCIKGGCIDSWGIENIDEFLKENESHKAHPYSKLIKGEVSLPTFIEENPKYLPMIGKLKNALECYKSEKSGYKNGYYYKRQCFWIWGKTGVGKSSSVRRLFPDLFNKPKNIWWDGYNNEEAVLIDDLGVDMGEFLKIWGDDYLFTAQIKFGTCLPLYRYLIITSNYSIDHFWPSINADGSLNTKYSELASAIGRRFIEINTDKYMDGKYFKFPDEQLLQFPADDVPVRLTDDVYVKKKYKTKKLLIEEAKKKFKLEVENACHADIKENSKEPPLSNKEIQAKYLEEENMAALKIQLAHNQAVRNFEEIKSERISMAHEDFDCQKLSKSDGNLPDESFEI